jgi:hypothetical protein
MCTFVQGDDCRASRRRGPCRHAVDRSTPLAKLDSLKLEVTGRGNMTTADRDLPDLCTWVDAGGHAERPASGTCDKAITFKGKYMCAIQGGGIPTWIFSIRALFMNWSSARMRVLCRWIDKSIDH